MGSKRVITAFCCTVLGASLLVVGQVAADAAGPAPAGRPGPEALSRSALEGALRRSDPAGVDAAVREAHRTLAELAARTPDAVGSASLVLSGGLGPARAADLVAGRGLDLIGAEAKAPVGANGEVFTLWFNDFELLDGSLKQRLERAVGKARFRNLRQADAAAPADAAKLRELATGDIRFYRLEVAAPYGRLAGLVGDGSIAAVVPDKDTSRVAALRALRADLASKRTIGPGAPPVRLDSGDPARGAKAAPGDPVLTNSGQRCAWQAAAGTLACEPTTWRPVSGDPAVDAGLPRREGQAAAGTNRPASANGTQADSNAFTDCNVPSNTEGCPNDFTYSPRPQTSGDQSFAVLVNSYPAGSVVFYDCYIEWVPGNGGSENDGGYWRTVCYPYAINTVAFTYGAAGWRSTWGGQTTTVGPNDTRAVSTLAFKGSDLNACDVDQFGATATCDRSDPNAIYVPSPGIEDELLIANPACGGGGTRDGNTNDWNRGCFYPTLAQSNLPSPYLDTTFGDPLSPEPYNLAIGSSNPAAIAERNPYTNYAEFFSYGFNNMIGLQAWHSVSVDARVNASAACLFGIARGEPDAFCYFPVDAVRVSEKATFTLT